MDKIYNFFHPGKSTVECLTEGWSKIIKDRIIRDKEIVNEILKQYKYEK